MHHSSPTPMCLFLRRVHTRARCFIFTTRPVRVAWVFIFGNVPAHVFRVFILKTRPRAFFYSGVHFEDASTRFERYPCSPSLSSCSPSPASPPLPMKTPHLLTKTERARATLHFSGVVVLIPERRGPLSGFTNQHQIAFVVIYRTLLILHLLKCPVTGHTIILITEYTLDSIMIVGKLNLPLVIDTRAVGAVPCPNISGLIDTKPPGSKVLDVLESLFQGAWGQGLIQNALRSGADRQTHRCNTKNDFGDDAHFSNRT
jgi:hypothetical protein